MRTFVLGLALSSIGLASAPAVASAQPVPPSAGNAPVPVITLKEAISRAKANEPAFATAAAASKVGALGVSIARSALLPNVIYHNQFLYTQSNGSLIPGGTGITVSAPRFVANNGVHEYTSQASVSETIGLQQFTAVSRASAAAAVASANVEIARRGLVATVVGLFYTSLASEDKVAVARRAAAEADSFVALAEQREAAREGAHADVVKAQLQQQQRSRDVADALALAQKAHLDLGVLLFPNPRVSYTLATATTPPQLPARADVEAAASRHNPELQSALASLRQSGLDVTAARAAYLPDLALNFSYGIDALQFAKRGPDGTRNLGYSASATLDIPVWDWFSTQHRVKQSEILRDAARVTLTATQRRLIAELDEFYTEAATARSQLESLDLSVRTAAESLRLTRLRYTAGEATSLEIVDAENSLTLAEMAREDGIVRYQMSLANLQMLTGTI
jgi:Outer membrane protein